MPNLSQTTSPNVIDISIPEISKKAFRFNNDDNSIVYIDVADMNITTRLNNIYPKLEEDQRNAGEILEKLGDENIELEDISAALNEIDATMRARIDELFDAPVSAAVAPSGSMYDLFNGEFRFNYIITAIMEQYKDNIQKEAKKVEQSLKKHTEKYAKGKK